MGTRSDVIRPRGTPSPGVPIAWSHLPGPPTRPLGHEGLLTLARKVRAAAADHDPQRLALASRRFVEALDRHLEAEATSLNQAVPGEARILKKGQARIRAAAAGLLVSAGRGCPTPHPDCGSRAEELLALLSLQARDEHRSLDRSAA